MPQSLEVQGQSLRFVTPAVWKEDLLHVIAVAFVIVGDASLVNGACATPASGKCGMSLTMTVCHHPKLSILGFKEIMVALTV